MTILRGSHRVPVLLFFGIYFFSGLSPIATSFDSRWTVYKAMSLEQHGDTNLDEYSAVIRESQYYGVQCVGPTGRVRIGQPENCNGHWYDSYPIGSTILTAPLIYGAVATMKLLHPLVQHFHTSQPVIAGFLRGDYDVAHALIEEEVASALLAAAAVVMYFITLRFLPVKPAVLLVLLFALATSAYSIAGRAIWQHTPSMLLLTLIIYMLLRAEEKPSLAAWVGLPVALSYTVRPTDSLFVLIFTLYVAVRHRKYLLGYLLAAAPIAVILLSYNYSIYHHILTPYYQTPLDGFLPRNWRRMSVGLAGNLISPSRGLFIFTPVFLFSIWSMVRQKWKTPLSPWLATLPLIHWLAVSSYVSNWWAGHCYGPRFFTDLTPIFILFLIPYFQNWQGLSRGLRIAFVTLALVGMAIHLRGGWSVSVIRWNVDPVNIDQHPERNWNWSDPPFLR